MYAWGFGIACALLAVRLFINDLRHYRLPNASVVALFAVTIGVVVACRLSPALFLGGVGWWALIAVSPRIYPRARAAAGDQKLALSLGTLAVLSAPWGWFLAVGLSGVIGAVFHKIWNNAAHGPGMILGTVVALASSYLVG